MNKQKFLFLLISFFVLISSTNLRAEDTGQSGSSEEPTAEAPATPEEVVATPVTTEEEVVVPEVDISGPPSKENILPKLTKSYERAETISSDIKEEYFDSQSGKDNEIIASVSIKRSTDGLFLMNLQSSLFGSTMLGADNDNLSYHLLVNPELVQSPSVNVLPFAYKLKKFFNPADFEKDFNVTEFEDKTKYLKVVLMPKNQASTNIKTVTIYVNKKALIIFQATSEETNGSKSTLKFSKLKVNPPLDDAIFNVKLPQGAKAGN